MSDIVVTDVTVEPVTLEQAKTHLGVVGSAHDTYITSLITMARQACEHELGRSIGEQTIELAIDDFPINVYGVGAPILLPRPPVTSITSLVYVDENGVDQTIDPSNYTVDSRQEPSWLCPAFGYDWPVPREQANAVRVTYVAGYTSATLPGPIRQWMLMLIGAAFENRENVIVNGTPQTMQFVNRIVDRYRVHAL